MVFRNQRVTSERQQDRSSILAVAMSETPPPSSARSLSPLPRCIVMFLQAVPCPFRRANRTHTCRRPRPLRPRSRHPCSTPSHGPPARLGSLFPPPTCRHVLGS